MSHAAGEVIQYGKIIGYFEYNGTADIILPKVYNTAQDLADHWRQGAMTCCTCKPQKGREPVILWSSYGFGSFCVSTFCSVCKLITGELNAMDINWVDGHPLTPGKTSISNAESTPL